VKRFALFATGAALALVVISSVAGAEPRTYTIDRAHSEVGFNVRHFFNKTHGRFNDYKGTIIFDPKSLPTSSVEVVIQDSSIFTGVDRRDNHLRTQDFFWTEKYPTITFKSTKVVPGKDEKHFKIEGNLTIRDVTKPVVLDAEFIGMGPVAIGGNNMGVQAGFEASTTVNRKDYGIVWNKIVDQGGTMLDDEVELVFSIAAVSRDNPPGGAPAQAAAPATGNK
jgi:polyisoprenoid-binding protein YceI